METDNNLPSNPTNSSQENVNPQPEPITSSKLPGGKRPGIVVIAVAVFVILVVVVVGGYIYLTQKGNIQVGNRGAVIPSQTPELSPTNIDTSQYGTVAFVFISANGKVGFLKEKEVDTSQWGGLTRVGELWT